MSQASHEFRGSVDFNQNELRNSVFQNLNTPPIGPKQGQIYFDSKLDLKSPFYWNSDEWIPFGLKPIHKRYSDEASMVAGQPLQIKYYIYYRSDEDIYYEYLGTTNGNMSDYNPIGGSGVISGTENYLTKYNSPSGLIESQIFDNGTNVGIGTTDFTDPARIVISGRVSQIGLSTNTYFGFRSGLNSNITDLKNTAFGYESLRDLTSGIANTAFGYRVLTKLTTGFLNTGIGADTLLETTTGSGNTAIGINTLQRTTTGGYNTAVGYLAMTTNTTGLWNTALGYFAGGSQTTARENVYVGFQAGQFNNGSYNTVVGSRTFENVLNSSNNVIIGYFSAQVVNALNNSVFIGWRSRPLGNNSTNEVAIGYDAVGWGSNSVTIGNSLTTKNRMWGTLIHAPAVLGSESATLDQLNSAVSGAIGSLSAGSGLTLTGTEFSLGDTNLTWTPGTGLIYGGDWENNFTPRTLVTQQYVTSEIIANAYVHPTFTNFTIDANGAQVIDQITTTTEGHVSNITLRNLTLADLGFIGDVDANNYIHPSYTPQNPTLTGALVLASIETDTIGSVVSITTRTLSTADIDAININQLGVANGVATLDGGGTLTESQLPASVLGGVKYIDNWNASTNTPTLPDPTTVKGNYYVVDVAGTQTGPEFDDGSITFAVKDWVISNGIVWKKVDNSEAVASVFGRLGNIVALAGDYTSFYVRHDVNNQGLTATQQGNARTNINAQQLITGGATTITASNLTANRALISNGSGKVAVSPVTSTELSYLDGVTSGIQGQLDSKLEGNEVITLTGDVTGTGATSIATTISNNAVTTTKIVNSNVTYAKIQDVSANRILGQTATTGVVKELTATEVRNIINVADGANNYVHPAKTWVDKTNLSGATVISNLTIDSLGHPTNWTTRELTPADIGAQPVGNYVTLDTTQTITGEKTIPENTNLNFGSFQILSDGSWRLNKGLLQYIRAAQDETDAVLNLLAQRVTLDNIGTASTSNFILVQDNTFSGIKRMTPSDLLNTIGAQPAGSYASASHTHSISHVSGLQSALDGKQAVGSYLNLAIGGQYLNSSADDIDLWVGGDTGLVSNSAQNSPIPIAGSGFHWVVTQNMYSSNSNDLLQMAYPFRGSGSIKWRTKNQSGVWGSWNEVWDSRNFNPSDYLTNASANLATILANGNTSTDEIYLTAVGNNITPATDGIRLSGYGIMGNRSAFYITNTGGDIVIGNSGVHNVARRAVFSSQGLRVFGTIIKDGGTSSQFLKADGSVDSTVYQPAGTYVTSVGLSMPSIFTVSGSPITSTGTLTATLNTQLAYRVFATGSDTEIPTFQQLVVNHLPNDIPFTKIEHIAANTILGRGTGTGVIQELTPSEAISIIGAVPTTRTITAGGGLTGGGSLSSNITISHLDTSSQASVTNSNGNIIQSIGLDTYGHTTSIGSINGDDRWARRHVLINSQSEWQYTSETGSYPGIHVGHVTTGSANFPSTLGQYAIFGGSQTTPTSFYARVFGFFRQYDSTNVYVGTCNDNGVSNGWALLYTSYNLNIGTLGGVADTRNITINGVTQNLSADRTWTIPTHDPVTLGTPNGLSLSGQQLSLGLASSGVTGALSGTDWDTFNGKIGGTIASGQVAFGTGSGTIGGDSGLTFNNILKRILVTSPTYDSILLSRTGSQNVALGFETTIGKRYIGFDLTSNVFGITSSVSAFGSAPFRVNPTNGNIFTSGNVGIGTTSFSGQKLRVNGTASFILGDSNNNDLRIEGYNNRGLSVGNANYGGIFGFQLNNNTGSGGAYGTAIHMNARYDGTNYISRNSFVRPQLLLLRDGDFRFYRSNPVTEGNNITLTEIVSITNEGTLGIGVSEPTETLDINGTTRIRTINNLGSTPTEVLVPSATGVVSKRTLTEFKSELGVVESINAGAGIQVNPNPTASTPQVALTGQALSFHSLTGDGFVYRTSGTVGVRTLTAGTGITITNGDGIGGNPTISLTDTPLTQSTGNFTPTLTDTSSGFSYTLLSAFGDYVKIGKLVYIAIQIRITSTSGSASGGFLRIGNLPFQYDEIGSSVINGSPSLIEFSGSALSSAEIARFRFSIVRGTSYMQLTYADGGSVAPMSLSSGGRIILSAIYTTNS